MQPLIRRACARHLLPQGEKVNSMEFYSMPKVLIADKLSPAAIAVFQERGLDFDNKPGMTKEELIACIGEYDGLAVRSATKVTTDVVAAAKKLKVVGRAGIGVDNVDIPAATAA